MTDETSRVELILQSSGSFFKEWRETYGEEGDVGDCFYNYTHLELASWFWLDAEGQPCADWRNDVVNITTIWDDDLGCYVTPLEDERLLFRDRYVLLNVGALEKLLSGEAEARRR